MTRREIPSANDRLREFFNVSGLQPAPNFSLGRGRRQGRHRVNPRHRGNEPRSNAVSRDVAIEHQVEEESGGKGGAGCVLAAFTVLGLGVIIFWEPLSLVWSLFFGHWSFG